MTKPDLTYEFVFTETCMEDMRHYRKRGLLSEADWKRIVYKAELEAQNWGVFKRFYHSERIKGAEEFHIRRLKTGNWRLLFLVKEDVLMFYGLAVWIRRDAYKDHEMEILLRRAKILMTTPITELKNTL